MEKHSGVKSLLSIRKVLFLIFIITAHTAYAEERSGGGYAGTFLRIGLGARAMAMGGGSTALHDDGYTAYYNPAGLVFLEKHYFTTTLNSMALDRRLFFIGYAQPIGNQKAEDKKGPMMGGFAAGWICAGVDNIDARDFNGNDTGTLSNWEHCFYFSFSLSPVRNFSVGVSGKLLYNRFPGITESGETISAVGFGFDIGVMYRILPNLSVGLCIKDLRSRYTWDTQNLWERGTQRTDHFLRTIRWGAAWERVLDRLLITLDLEKTENLPLRYYTGIQINTFENLFLRCGLRDGELTFGTGYRISMLNRIVQMDYGFVPDPVAPRGMHVFTWSFIF